jgi:tartrate dehydrogenase/decarboxylase/D-malate dehydrogenase
MMLDHLGHGGAARALVQAIERILGESDTKAPDLGGIATTTDVGEAITSEARALIIS